ncbi:MAG: sugar phosphate nucleotidyltransferase, partial [Desulfobacterota bacterium]|nr:sugar phosphate nucleotidyltransferase [Thermodesulfobacteriota bacterium]
DTFMLTYGDGVGDINIPELLAFHDAHGKIATVTGVKPLSRFGFLSIQGNRVISFAEKPPVREEYINGGFFVFTRSIFAYLDNTDDCMFEREPMERLAADGELMVYRHDGYWHCMDTIRDRDMLEREWQQEKPGWKVWG